MYRMQRGTVVKLLRRAKGDTVKAAELCLRRVDYFEEQVRLLGLNPDDYTPPAVCRGYVTARAIALDSVDARVQPRKVKTYFGVPVSP